MRNLIVVATFVLGILLTGCASVPMASLESDTARKSFPSPSPGTAGLYIYRNTNFGGALKKFIYIDGELVAETAPMTYFYFEVPGGTRKLSTESEFSENDLIVDVEQGKNYFVRQAIKMGLFVGGAKLELVPEEEGKNGVLECKLGNNLNGNVMVNTEDIKTPEIASQSITGGEVSALEYYGQAEEEINTQTYDKNLWAKALVEVEGDEQKRKARYIELRANQLYSEKVGSISNTNQNIQQDTLTEKSPSDKSDIQVSGKYLSDTTGNIHRILKTKNPVVKLIQNGITITGTFGDKGGKIWGDVEANTIRFDWALSGSGYGEGKWTLKPGSSEIVGTWFSTWLGEGDWNLTKIE